MLSDYNLLNKVEVTSKVSMNHLLNPKVMCTKCYIAHNRALGSLGPVGVGVEFNNPVGKDQKVHEIFEYVHILPSKKCFKDARAPKATIVTDCDGDITQFFKNNYDSYLCIYVENNSIGSPTQQP